MAKLYNLARMTTATAGTGTITLGSAVGGFLTFALAGVADGDTVAYGIRDGANSEVGTGTYTAAGTALTRTVTRSTNSNSAISLSGNAEVYITARAEDIPPIPVPVASGGTSYTGGAWSTYTATLTPNTGTITQGGAASFLQIGKLVFYSIDVTVTATTGSPASFNIDLPVAVKRTVVANGEETGNTGLVLHFGVIAGNTRSTAGILDATIAVRAPTVNDRYSFCGCYEAS